MKQWMSRFAVLAVLGTVLCSALVMGCGGGEEEDTGMANGTNNTTAPAPPPAP